MHVSDDPRVGTELAGYRIESLLGLGGMSVVYVAEDLRLKRRVALKVLAASLAEDESFRERFLRESELTASIDHPNIIPIYEAGATDELLVGVRPVHVGGVQQRHAEVEDRYIEEFMVGSWGEYEQQMVERLIESDRVLAKRAAALSSTPVESHYLIQMETYRA